MTSQRKYTLIWLLLPLLALRGLVPAGFMIDTSGGRLSMMLCSGSVSTTMVTGEHAQHLHHAGQGSSGEHGQHGEHGGNSVCPFAAAGMGAPAPHLLTITLDAQVTDEISVDLVAFHSPFGPSRVQQSRAPPYFS
jgi:hypothetical protein